MALLASHKQSRTWDTCKSVQVATLYHQRKMNTRVVQVFVVLVIVKRIRNREFDLRRMNFSNTKYIITWNFKIYGITKNTSVPL